MSASPMPAVTATACVKTTAPEATVETTAEQEANTMEPSHGGICDDDYIVRLSQQWAIEFGNAEF